MTSKIKVDNINKVSDDSNIIKKCGTTITLGASGDSIALASGASQSGFGRSGSVNWDTTPKTATFTGVSGNGYFVNTTGGVVTVNLPASPSAGDIIAVVDYAGTSDTNNITIGRNGSNINGAASDQTISNENSGATFVYVDGTQGWKATETANLDDITLAPLFVDATVSGSCNTIVTDNDHKIAIFKGPGTFTVSCAGNAAGSTSLEYLVVAGGGGGGGTGGPGCGGRGGGGAGGFRLFTTAPGTNGTSPATPGGLNAPGGLTAAAQAYPITVGGGGSPGPSSGSPGGNGGRGNDSTFSTITSTSGGGGAGYPVSPAQPFMAGGSGGGNYGSLGGGAGNTPPTSPPQGNPGATLTGNIGGSGSGGGGAGGAAPTTPGGPVPTGGGGGAGGIGSNISDNFIGPTAPSYGTGGPVGSTRYFSGGGGGGSYQPQSTATGAGGSGGGGPGNPGGAGNGVNGTTNTGGGAGSAGSGPHTGGTGGSGIVMIRYKFQ